MIEDDPLIKRLIQEQVKAVSKHQAEQKDNIITELLMLTPIVIDYEQLNNEQYCKELICDLYKIGYTFIQKIDIQSNKYTATLYKDSNEVATRTITFTYS